MSRREKREDWPSEATGAGSRDGEIEMPMRSVKQRKWMHANKPKMAEEWEKHTPKGKKMPKRVKPKGKRK